MQRCPAAPKADPRMPAHGLVDHRVGHDHHVVLGPAERLDSLARSCRALVDQPRHRRGADERDGVDARVVEDALNDLASTVHQIDHPGRKAQRVEHLERDLLSQRHLLRRLEDERVAAGDRERQEPERDHRREVEGHDGGAHAHRLADRLAVHAARHVLEHPPLHRGRHGAGALDHLDHPRHLRAGVVDRLAHLGRDRARQLLAASVESLAEGEHQPRALDHAHVTPARQRLARRLHGRVEIGGR